MDIYQIWTTYNPMWSEREIICFSVLMILVMAMVIQGIQKKWNPIQGTAIVVLVPMGLLLPIIINHKVKLNWALLAGFLISVVIELSQLIFKRGLFEWDDMIHNALSCMLGGWVMNWIFVKLKNCK